MARKPEQPVEVTQEQIEAALVEHTAVPPVEGHPVMAFNPAEFARKAAALAKIAAPFIAIAASTNWKNPIAASKALVQLYALLQGTQDNPEGGPVAA